MKFDQVVEMVRAERACQDEQWGGHEHDVTHDPVDWASYIEKQVLQLNALTWTSPDESEERLVKIAALAFAALEARSSSEQATESAQ